MTFFLGIDGGGTKTECAAGDETRVLGRAGAASCKIQAVGEEQARTALHAAIREACQQAGVNPRQVARVCVGLAGVSRPDIRRLVTAMVGEIVPGEVQVVGDNDVAMQAAFGELPGVIVIAGTGSIAYGRNRKGEQARAGGWGAAVSDEGSGQWIGRGAVAEVLCATDAGRSTTLQRAVMQAWNARDLEDLVTIANRIPPPDFAALFPVVLEQARAGDAVAASILRSAGQQLAELARTVIQRLWGDSTEAIAVRWAGGVFRGSEQVREAFRAALQQSSGRAKISDEIVEPVLGALALARRASQNAGGSA